LPDRRRARAGEQQDGEEEGGDVSRDSRHGRQGEKRGNREGLPCRSLHQPRPPAVGATTGLPRPDIALAAYAAVGTTGPDRIRRGRPPCLPSSLPHQKFTFRPSCSRRPRLTVQVGWPKVGFPSGGMKLLRQPKFVQLKALKTSPTTPTETLPKVRKSFSRRKSIERSAKPQVVGGRMERSNGCVRSRAARSKPCEKSRTFVAPPVPKERVAAKRNSQGKLKMPLATMRSRSLPGTSWRG